VKLAIAERNEAGGVAGYMVELVALNDDGDPSKAALQARKMALDSDVMGVIGGFSRETALASLDWYHIAGLAFITPSAADAITERGYPEVFRLFASNEYLGREAAHYAVEELGARRLAVLRGYDDLADSFAKSAEELGARVVVDISISNQGWISSLYGCDLVFFSGGGVEGAQIIAEARRVGVEAVFMGGSELGSSLFLRIGGDAIEGTFYVTSAPKPSDLPSAEGFVASYKRLAGDEPGPLAVISYDSACVLLKALELVIEEEGKPRREAVIEKLKGIRYRGLTGSISFDSHGGLLSPRVYIYCVEMT
jgi:branched-chain amino acid transport system substrate-binding protein